MSSSSCARITHHKMFTIAGKPCNDTTLEYEGDRLSRTSCKIGETCEVETKWNGKLGYRRPTHTYNYTRYWFSLVYI